MDSEPADPGPRHWSEPTYPTDEEIAQLPDYIHPATRWALAFISLVVGCVASAIAVTRLTQEPDAGKGAAWLGLISGLCWMMAGITMSRGRMTGTALWFLLGIVTGIILTVM